MEVTEEEPHSALSSARTEGADEPSSEDGTSETAPIMSQGGEAIQIPISAPSEAAGAEHNMVVV